ncbi:MAG: cell division protein FtsZ [Sulfuricella sp.]|nr:cell division protein FtsZ [Sulfuricella sp.]
MFEIVEVEETKPVIKLIGVGGCGGNAVTRIIGGGLNGVEFISINTDAQALKRNSAPTQLQLGKGLGAGGKPEVGREAAMVDRERIAELIEGADMLFIAAGMGGGTGTGAAPVVAQIARDMDIITVAVVSKPFDFEGGKRMKLAMAGMSELEKFVNSMIIVPNQRLLEVLDADISMAEAFQAADGVLHSAVAGIAEIINNPADVNVDFADVKTIMSESGKAMMGTATASGPDRARVAAESVVRSPLLEDVDLSGARGVLVNITGDMSLKLKEVTEVMNTIRESIADDATVIYGQTISEDAGDMIHVTLVATGLGQPKQPVRQQPTMTIIKTGTDDIPMEVNYDDLDTPAVMRRGRGGLSDSGRSSSSADLEIPAFLRKQAD